VRSNPSRSVRMQYRCAWRELFLPSHVASGCGGHNGLTFWRVFPQLRVVVGGSSEIKRLKNVRRIKSRIRV
jgi:hypothetical protein